MSIFTFTRQSILIFTRRPLKMAPLQTTHTPLKNVVNKQMALGSCRKGKRVLFENEGSDPPAKLPRSEGTKLPSEPPRISTYFLKHVITAFSSDFDAAIASRHSTNAIR